ncbi:MAG: hypothetical protein ACK5ON_06365 [Flavobacterium sp.]
MRFEIPFNENISREDSKKYFDFIWKDVLKKNKKNLYVVFPLIVFGITIIYGKSNLGYLILAFGFFAILTYYYFYKHYKKERKRYFEEVEKHISEYSSQNKSCFWEFNEEQFYYSDFKYDLKVNWSSFTKFRIVENNLILELRDNIIATFFLNKEEVGQENFDKIIHFLEAKIKNN